MRPRHERTVIVDPELFGDEEETVCVRRWPRAARFEPEVPTISPRLVRVALLALALVIGLRLLVC